MNRTDARPFTMPKNILSGQPAEPYMPKVLSLMLITLGRYLFRQRSIF
jgi:hypothetical protein